MKKFVGFLFVAALIVALAFIEDSGDTHGKDAGRDFFITGKTVTARSSWIACRLQADLDRAKELARQGDKAAAIAYASIRDCRVVRAGDGGIVEDSSVRHGSTCVRASGDPFCYWFPSEFLAQTD